MARLAVLASGNGSNFQALAEALRARPAEAGPAHECVLLIHDRKAAYAAARAGLLGVRALHVGYQDRGRESAEAEMADALSEARVDLVALAGFMRILSPDFVRPREGRIVNIHPSLLPKWPGARAIERAYEAGEREFGATVHSVDEGMDTGPILARASFVAMPGSLLAEIESKVHELEHHIYPRTVIELLDAIDGAGKIR